MQAQDENKEVGNWCHFIMSGNCFFLPLSLSVSLFSLFLFFLSLLFPSSLSLSLLSKEWGNWDATTSSCQVLLPPHSVPLFSFFLSFSLCLCLFFSSLSLFSLSVSVSFSIFTLSPISLLTLSLSNSLLLRFQTSSNSCQHVLSNQHS